jgi:hypothetical protein
MTSVELDYSANPTMEMIITRNVDGAAWVELADDGKVSGCVGSDHSNHEEYRQLRALRGKWTATASGLDITFDTASWRSCTLSTETYDPKLVLHCTFGDRRLAVPAGVTVLVCHEDTMDGMAIGFAFEARMRGPIPDAPVGPWIVLGRDPGVDVTVSLPARETAPKIVVKSGAGALVEKPYIDPPKHK